MFALVNCRKRYLGQNNPSVFFCTSLIKYLIHYSLYRGEKQALFKENSILTGISSMQSLGSKAGWLYFLCSFGVLCPKDSKYGGIFFYVIGQKDDSVFFYSISLRDSRVFACSSPVEIR